MQRGRTWARKNPAEEFFLKVCSGGDQLTHPHWQVAWYRPKSLKYQKPGWWSSHIWDARNSFLGGNPGSNCSEREKSLKGECFQELYHINIKLKKSQRRNLMRIWQNNILWVFSYSLSSVESRICLPVNNSPNITGCCWEKCLFIGALVIL